MVSIITLRGDRLAHEHIHWDQGTVLRQLGLLPEYAAFPYAIDGKEAEGGKKYEVPVPVAGKETAAKLADEGCVESNLLMGRVWRAV
jgi:carboxymethylenebutenolidase